MIILYKLKTMDRLLITIASWIVLFRMVNAISYTCKMEHITDSNNSKPSRQQFCVFHNVKYTRTTTDIQFASPESVPDPPFIKFENSTMEYLPREFLQRFGPHLQILRVENCNLKSVVITSKMQELYASDNYITNVIVHQTVQNSPLSRLYLPKNRLSDISNITSKLVNLQVLDLSRNEPLAKESTLNLAVFNSLPKLTDLLLADVGAFYIKYDEELNLPSLILLDLSMNSLIPSDLNIVYFQSLQSLETLRLQHNNLAQLDYTHLTDIKSLKDLFLDGNSFPCEYLQKMITYLNENKINVRAGTVAENCLPGFSILQGLCCQGYVAPPPIVTPAPSPSKPATTTTAKTTEKSKSDSNEKDDGGRASHLQYSLAFATVTAIVVSLYGYPGHF